MSLSPDYQRRSALRGMIAGIIACLPIIIWCAWLAAPRLEIVIAPILEIHGDVDRPIGPPWNVQLRTPWWVGQRPCWQMAIRKLRAARPLAHEFYRTSSDGVVPINVAQINDSTGAETYFVNHAVGQHWVSTYCADQAPGLERTRAVTIGGSFVYQPSHNLWRVSQDFPMVVVAPDQPAQ